MKVTLDNKDIIDIVYNGLYNSYAFTANTVPIELDTTFLSEDGKMYVSINDDNNEHDNEPVRVTSREPLRAEDIIDYGITDRAVAVEAAKIVNEVIQKGFGHAL